MTLEDKDGQEYQREAMFGQGVWCQVCGIEADEPLCSKHKGPMRGAEKTLQEIIDGMPAYDPEEIPF